jgi:Ni/Fe-hydrogenase subunit HybB-like protein
VSSHREHITPVGGSVWTPTFIALTGIFVAGMLLTIWRFWTGIGPSSTLSDGYPWGSWKVFNVIVLTAVGSGGYAMALLVYALNKGRYHPIIRTAILTSVLGYTTGVIALGMDIGRPWNFYRIIFVNEWNLHSPLLEIAVCISAYLIFLWIEMAMPMFERWVGEPRSRMHNVAKKGKAFVQRYFAWIVAAAIVLPSMHQSSLGSLFILSGPRVHGLWQTPLLPLLFLISCWFLGYACVVAASMLSSVVYKRPLEWAILRDLSRVVAWVVVAFLVIRWVDVIVRGQLGAAFALDGYSLFFLLEIGLLSFAASTILTRRAALSPGTVFQMAGVILLGGTVYRLGPSLVGFMPGSHWSYFPNLTELVITMGFMALAVMAYMYTVRQFPILTAYPAPAREAPDA